MIGRMDPISAERAGLGIQFWEALRLGGRLTLLGSATGVLLILSTGLSGLGSWPLFYTGAEIVQAFAVSLLMGLIAGAVLGSVCALILVPIAVVLLRGGAMSGALTRGAGMAAGAVCSVALVDALVMWLRTVLRLGITNFEILMFSLASVLSGIAFLRLRPGLRNSVSLELEAAFTGRSTRRFLLGSGAAAIAALVIEKPVIARCPSPPPNTGRGKPNILMVTFDALSAEDMSLYGASRNTTPHMEAFARCGTVFDNFYSTGTFTTPGISAIVTGRYPSTTRMIHLKDRFRGRGQSQTLLRCLRDAGYRTGASFNNPWAHFGRAGLGSEFDVLPPPAAFEDVMPEWAARQSFLDVVDYQVIDIAFLRERAQMLFPRHFEGIRPTFDAEASFRQAEDVLRRLDLEGGPHFTWLHVFAPHFPYNPEPPFLHRYLAGDTMRNDLDYWRIGGVYPAAMQGQVDLARARYDEFVAQTDAQFGAFLERIRDRLDDTIIVVSADHGESFNGGFWSHGSPAQYRPNIHIPLIIRRPGEKSAVRCARVADQTALAPTLLEAAGLDVPHWMESGSLLPDMDGHGSGGGFAFTQHLDSNSAFGPLTRGSLGVIDGKYQYVLDIGTMTGKLFMLSEADLQDVDLSRARPEDATRLRAALRDRFPHFTGV